MAFFFFFAEKAFRKNVPPILTDIYISEKFRRSTHYSVAGSLSPQIHSACMHALQKPSCYLIRVIIKQGGYGTNLSGITADLAGHNSNLVLYTYVIAYNLSCTHS